MAAQTGTGPRKGKGGARGWRAPAARRARGFSQASELIGAQMGTLRAQRGFAQARLAALWPEIAGAEIAAICHPVRLAPARGAGGALLTLGADGSRAPQLQMLLPMLRARINAALGPSSVGRIQIVHAAGPAPAPPDPPRPRATPEALPPGDLARGLSSIGDEQLRAALQTLARNVLSRLSKSQEPGS